MKRREFIKMAALGTLAHMSSTSFGVSPSRKPNFLFVIADDCTFRDIGCYDGQIVRESLCKDQNILK